MSILYTAEALSTGEGRKGHVTSASGRVNLDLAPPKQLGGNGEGANPEELFAAGFAACFHSALHLVSRQRHVPITDSAVRARVHLIPNEKSGFGLAVELDVTIPNMDTTDVLDLAHAAHEICPYSNAVRGNVWVDITSTPL